MATISSVINLELMPNGGCKLGVKDESGRAYSITVSPRAQAELFDALLASPPMQQGRPMPRGPLMATSVALSEDENKQVVLEALLGPRKAIHILLPRACIAQMKKLLNEWLTPNH